MSQLGRQEELLGLQQTLGWDQVSTTLDEKSIYATSHSILQLRCVFSSNDSSQLRLPMSELWSLLLYRNTFQPRNVQVVEDYRFKVKI